MGIAEHAARSDAMAHHAILGVTRRAAAAAIHVAVPTTQFGCSDDGRIVAVGLLDGDVGMVLHVTVGRAAIHVAFDDAAVDGDVAAARVGQLERLGERIVLLPFSLFSANDTTTAAVHIAVVEAVGADLSTRNVDKAATRVRNDAGDGVM